MPRKNKLSSTPRPGRLRTARVRELIDDLRTVDSGSWQCSDQGHANPRAQHDMARALDALYTYMGWSPAGRVTQVCDKPRQRAVCKYCGGTDVLFDAYVEWDEIGQRYDVQNVMDKGHYCATCDSECSVTWIDIVSKSERGTHLDKLATIPVSQSVGTRVSTVTKRNNTKIND